jgi:hypothetical protein
MKSPFSFIFLLSLCLFTVSLSAQSLATEKGNGFVSGTVNVSSVALNLAGAGRTFVYDIRPAYQHFVMDRLAIGGTATIAGFSASNVSQSQIGLGPKATYFFDSGGNWIPYINAEIAGLRSQTDNVLGGVNEVQTFVSGKVSGGMALRVNQLAVLFDLGYGWDSENGVGGALNRISFSIGLAGFLYEDEEDDRR